jgi:hypothetical protein
MEGYREVAALGAWYSNASLITYISYYGDKSESYVNNKDFPRNTQKRPFTQLLPLTTHRPTVRLKIDLQQTGRLKAPKPS